MKISKAILKNITFVTCGELPADFADFAEGVPVLVTFNETFELIQNNLLILLN